MKKLLLALAVISAALIAPSCSTADKAARQQQKVINAQLDSIRAVNAMNALHKNDFIIGAERITLKHGGSYTANSTINFISIHGDQGAVQLASPAMTPGPNGLGGITLEGAVRNIKLYEDKKGNATLSYVLSGSGLTADITVRLPKGSSTASVTIDAGYSVAGMSVTGTLHPYDASQVVKGASF